MDAVNNAWETQMIRLRERVDNGSPEWAAKFLGALVPSITYSRVIPAVEELMQILTTSDDFAVTNAVADLLAEIAPQLAEDANSHLCILIVAFVERESHGVLEGMHGTDCLDAAIRVMAALAPNLEPDQVDRSADIAEKLLLKPSDPFAVAAGAEITVALAMTLTAQQVDDIAMACTTTLKQSKDRLELEASCNAIIALAPRLSSEQVTSAWDAVIDRLRESEDDWHSRDELAAALAALVPSVGQDQITWAGDAAINMTAKAEHSWQVDAAGAMLVAIQSHISQPQFARAADTFIATMNSTNDSNFRFHARERLIGVAPQLTPLQRQKTLEVLLPELERYYEFEYPFYELVALLQLSGPQDSAGHATTVQVYSSTTSESEC
ncbi:MAG: hypothetical protein R3C19_17030 [Planctomycetaceae bacterium]